MMMVTWGILWLSPLALAGVSGVSSPAGDVDSILDIRVIPFDNLSSVLPELRTYDTPPSGILAARFIISNNDPSGFSITLKSQTEGKLVRLYGGVYPERVKRGDAIDYELDIERGGEGTMGGEIPPASERRGLVLTVPRMVKFASEVAESTIDTDFNVMMHTRANNKLFFGTFKDVLTFVVSDL